MVLTILKTRYAPRRKARTLSTGSLSRPRGSAERGPSTWHPAVQERPVPCPRRDDGVSHARHFGGERRHRLAATVGIIRVPGDISSELVAEAVVALTRGDLCSHPEGTAQAGIET